MIKIETDVLGTFGQELEDLLRKHGFNHARGGDDGYLYLYRDQEWVVEFVDEKERIST